MSIQSIKNYLSLVKFSHTIFAMPFAFIGLFMGIFYENKPFDWKIVVLVVLCMIFARSAAMAFNRFIDEKFDKLNPRTAVREIPSGIIKKENALIFIILNCGLFIATTFFINSICFYLSPVALFVILFYSYTKRFTPLCHLVLGLGLALAPIGAYLAVTGYFSLVPILFSFVVLTWVSGFDILYALQDEDFDRTHNLKSIPVFLGRNNSLRLSVVLHVITALLIIAIGLIATMNYWYWIGTVLFVGLLVYQHTIVKPNDISKVNMAFATTNGIASVVYAFFVILSLL